MIRRTLFTALLGAGLASGQTPPTPPTDGGRQPIEGPTIPPPTGFDQGRIPVTQGAGTGMTIQGFPAPTGPAPIAQQMQPSRPVLSPYLNLFRGAGGGGISAVDYYNFVRPAEQTAGSFIGRPFGQSVGPGGRGIANTVDPETGLQSYARPAGTPSAFMNTGGYFNRMGSIGMAGRAPQAQTSTPSRSTRR
ncbi:MAG: hypothetical protein K1X57_13205 [Gemmataceae bacterium]|nr:hypothetical protein [Gemmataceae bacterium]